MRTIGGLRPAVLLLTLLLSACLQSERRLFSPAEAVTPLGAEFSIGPVGPDGSAALGNQGAVEIVRFVQAGQVYQAQGTELMFFQPFRDRSLYLAQFTRPAGQGGRTEYFTARFRGGLAEVSIFGVDDDLLARLSPTLAPVTKQEGMWVVGTRDDLLAIAREAVAQNRLQGPERFRIMAAESEVEAYRREAEQKRAARPR